MTKTTGNECLELLEKHLSKLRGEHNVDEEIGQIGRQFEQVDHERVVFVRRCQHVFEDEARIGEQHRYLSAEIQGRQPDEHDGQLFLLLLLSQMHLIGRCDGHGGFSLWATC